MKLALINSRAPTLTIGFDHCLLSRPGPNTLQLFERTHFARIFLAAIVLGFGLSCVPAMLDKPIRGFGDGILYFSPVIAFVVFGLLIGYKTSVITFDRSSGSTKLETYLGRFRLRRRLDEMTSYRAVHIWSEFVNDPEGPDYWIHFIGLKGDDGLRICSRNAREAWEFGETLAEFMGLKYLDERFPESCQ